MAVGVLSGGPYRTFHYLRTDRNGNLLLSATYEKEMPPSNIYITEIEHLGFGEAKSILTPSWDPNNKKTYIWKSEKINDTSSDFLYPKEVRSKKIYPILLKMFGYTNTSNPTIDKIIRKTYNSESDSMERMFEEDSWELGESNSLRDGVDQNYYLSHPKKEEYLKMIRNQEVFRKKSKLIKKSVKRKPKKVVKKCKCK
jgi:hypothetical protein